MDTSKLIREEALKIIYGGNQFYVEGYLEHDITEVLNSNHEHWPDRMRLIKQLCIKLNVNDWRSCGQAVQDEFFRCIKNFFLKERLTIRFVISTSHGFGEPPMEPLKDFCKQVMVAELGTVEVFVFGPSYYDRVSSPLLISTLSGSFLEVAKQNDDARGLLDNI